MKDFSKIKSTKEIKISNNLADQIIGQDLALTLIKKAAKQRRNVLLIGEPGTGKSLLGQALAELSPKEKLVDIVSLPNLTDENNPSIKTYPRGQAKQIISTSKLKAAATFKNQTWLILLFAIIISLLPYYFWK
ncbi:MAG: ATP-binding protein, partial [Nanoarchaeota archaeon]